MTAPLARRVAKLERETEGPAMGPTLEQLVEGSMGHDPGPPRKPLQGGQLDLEVLVAGAVPIVGIR